MNVLMAYPVHPATPHISAVRAWRFAGELAGRGHRVVFVTGEREGQHGVAVPNLAAHDWAEPALYVCPLRSGVPDRPTGHWSIRRANTALRMLRDGGRYAEWVRSAVATAAAIARRFRPDVVWCTLGMLESVFAARRIAIDHACGWVLDVKDNWDLYIPRGIRRPVAWRIRGWAAVTANAEYTAAVAARYLGTVPTVIYSGVDDVFYRTPADDAGERRGFVLNLVGSVYDQERLAALMSGIREWLDCLPDGTKSEIRFRYLGADTEMVAKAAGIHLSARMLELPGYVSAGILASYCKSAAANIYISYPATFHHKLLELLCCGVPVIAVGQGRGEFATLAAAIGGRLIAVEEHSRLMGTLDLVHAEWSCGTAARKLVDVDRRFSWARQTEVLESVLERARAAGLQS